MVWSAFSMFKQNIAIAIFSCVIGVILFVLFLFGLIGYFEYPLNLILIDENKNLYLSKYSVSFPVSQITRVSYQNYRYAKSLFKTKEGEIIIYANRKKYKYVYVTHCEDVAKIIIELKENAKQD